MPQQAGDEGLPDLGQVRLAAGVVEGVAAALEHGEVGVHAAAPG